MEVFLIYREEEVKKMKKMWKKRTGKMITAAILCSCILLSGCGKKKELSAVADANVTSKNYVYRQEIIELPEGVDPSTFTSLNAIGDRIHAMGYGTNETGGTVLKVYSLKPDGSDLKTVDLIPENGCNYITFGFDKEGSIYAHMIVYAGYEAPEKEGDEPTDSNYIVKFDETGHELWKTRTENPPDELSYYVNSIVCTDDGEVIVSDTNGISHFDAGTGSPLGKLVSAADSQDEYGTVPQLFALADGRVVMAKNNEYMLDFHSIDTKTGKVSDKLGEISYFDFDYLFTGVGGNQDILAAGESGIYAVKMGEEPKIILNFVDSDIDSTDMYIYAAINDKEIVTVLTDPLTEETDLTKFIKVPPEEVKDKKVITLGCYYIDNDVRTEVIKFNKTNTDYRIRIIDYMEFDSEEDWAGETRLNTDIVSGNTPDILMLDPDMPVGSYISKGLFEDVTPWFEKDEELSKMDYLDNIMELFKTDGKMYQIVPYFNIETVAIGKSDYDTLKGWTLQDLEDLAQAKGVETLNIFGPFAQEDVLYAAVDLTGSQFINWETKKCSYDSKNFIHLLEFIAKFPEELTEEEDVDDTSSFWRSGKSILQRLYLSSFSDYNYMKKGVYGQDIILCGFPSDVEGSSGASVFPGIRLSMSATSKVKDGCWEFMRIFLGQEFQNKVNGYFPMSEERLAQLAEEAQNRPYYLDANGNKVEYDDTWMIGDMTINIDPMTKAETQEVISYIKSMDAVGSYNESVMNIITEEAGAFLSGQKSAEEVAGIIQSRVQIYVNENG